MGEVRKRKIDTGLSTLDVAVIRKGANRKKNIGGILETIGVHEIRKIKIRARGNWEKEKGGGSSQKGIWGSKKHDNNIQLHWQDPNDR